MACVLASFCLILLTANAFAAADSAEVEVNDWNAGVTYYEGGDVTNALRVLRPLMLSKRYGARAAEVVAKLEYERGNREEAVAASQIALRTSPDDARANRNFTRAADGLLAQREKDRIEAVIKAAQGKDSGAMMKSATDTARRLMAEAGTYRTNAAERAVALSDRYSAEAEKLSDVWIPLREVIVQSITNQNDAATVLAAVEQAQARTKKAALEFADLSGEAYGSMSEAEHAFTRFLKATALPPLAADEGLVAQSNAWLDVETVNGREWQPEALDFTRAFRQKFPAWAKAYEQRAQSDTNLPPFTAETQAKISALAHELEKIQMECCEKHLPPEQEKALRLLDQIRELLPKDKNGGGSGQNNRQQQQKDQQQNDKQNQDQQNQQDQKQDQQQDQRQGEQEESPQKDDQSEASEQEEKPEDKELEAILKKAQERNDEHEAEKKARMRKAPLPPNERDW